MHVRQTNTVNITAALGHRFALFIDLTQEIKGVFMVRFEDNTEASAGRQGCDFQAS